MFYVLCSTANVQCAMDNGKWEMPLVVYNRQQSFEDNSIFGLYPGFAFFLAGCSHRTIFTPPLTMKRKRKLIGIILSGLFLTYFSASFIFVPSAPGLKDQDTTIVKLESNDNGLKHGVLRSSSEQVEDGLKLFNDFAFSSLAGFHTVEQQNRLEVLANSQFHTYHIYLSLRRLQI